MTPQNAALELAAQECDILAAFADGYFEEPQSAMRLRQAAANIRDLMHEDPHEIAQAVIERARGGELRA